MKKRERKKNSRFGSVFNRILPNSKRSDSRFESVFNRILPNSKRSQITIFIILAIIILAIVLIVLYLNQSRIGPIITREASPLEKIRGCVQDSLQEGVNLLGRQGGAIDPTNFFPYKGEKVDYLCYTEEYYKRCVVQKPLLRRSVEQELIIFLQPRVEDCISAVKSSLEKKDYTVSIKDPEISTRLLPKNIIVDIGLDLKISKEKTEIYEDIRTDIDSKLYELVMIASSIIAWEARFGDSEVMSYMMYYPNIKVEKKMQSDGTKIYIITDRKSNEKFMFASRSMALPPGVTGR